MTQSLAMTFEGHVPSKKNSRISLRKRPVTLPSMAFVKWHKEQIAKFSGMGLPNFQGCVNIRYEFHIQGKKSPRIFDLTSQEDSINDLLVDLRVIKDDQWAILCGKSSSVVNVSQGDSHQVVVTITEVNPTWEHPIKILKSQELTRWLADEKEITLTEVRRLAWESIEQGRNLLDLS